MILAKVRRFWLLYVIIGILVSSFVWEVPKVSALCMLSETDNLWYSNKPGVGGGYATADECKKAEAGDTSVTPVVPGPSVTPEPSPTFPEEEGGEEGGEEGASDKELYKKCTDYMDLAWWACPVLVNAAKAADSLTKSIDDGFLKSKFAGVSLIIEKDYLKNNGDTHKLWRELMNFVNTGLIIVLLIIIFSQLTGYGIDNYGIKKMLPKVVVAAIIMNLSFLICQIAVDAVNIIGKGVISMAKALPVDTEFGWLVVLSAIFGIGALGVATGGISTIALVIFLIVAAIAGIITYTTFILSVGIWSLLTVALIVVSPLAIFCHILPNTEKYFKYWWKVFMGCLVFYPIVAGLYALSTIMRGIAFSNGDEKIVVMIGLMMGFIPFYFAPKILKKTLVGLDGIGVAMAGLAAKTAHTAKKGANLARKSPPGQNLEKNIRAGVARSNMKAYERVRGNKGSTRDKIQNFFAGGQSGYLRSRALLNKTESEDRAAELLGSRDRYRGYDIDKIWEFRDKAAKNGNHAEVAMFDTYGYDRFSGQWASKVASNLVEYDPSNERQRRSVGELQKYFENNKDFAAAVKKSSTAAYKLVLNGGNANYAHYDERNKNNNAEDWVTQNLASVEFGVTHKSLTTEIHEELLSNHQLRSRLDGDVLDYLEKTRPASANTSTTSQTSTASSSPTPATDSASAASGHNATGQAQQSSQSPAPQAPTVAAQGAPDANALGTAIANAINSSGHQPSSGADTLVVQRDHGTPAATEKAKEESGSPQNITISGSAKVKLMGETHVNGRNLADFSQPVTPTSPPNSNQQGQK